MLIKNMVATCPYQSGFNTNKNIIRWKKTTDSREDEITTPRHSEISGTYRCHCRARYNNGHNSGKITVLEMQPWYDGMSLANIDSNQKPILCKIAIHNPNKKDYEYLKNKLNPEEEFESDA